MRIFITGATGFIGNHVLDRFRNTDDEILILKLPEEDFNENKNIKYISGDFSNLDTLKTKIIDFNPDVVIHLAWQGIPDYSEKISQVNLFSSIQLLDFIIDNTNCKKIIVSGSCFEYGAKKGITKESDSININSFFAWAKLSLYEYLNLKCEKKNINLIWFRIYYVYGPGQRKNSLVPYVINSLKLNEIPQINNPMNRNDFVYVKDVANAFNIAVEKNISSGIYNLGYGVSTSVYNIIKISELLINDSSSMSELILKKSKTKKEIDFWADISKTTKVLKWCPQISIQDGIKKYINNLEKI